MTPDPEPEPEPEPIDEFTSSVKVSGGSTGSGENSYEWYKNIQYSDGTSCSMTFYNYNATDLISINNAWYPAAAHSSDDTKLVIFGPIDYLTVGQSAPAYLMVKSSGALSSMGTYTFSSCTPSDYLSDLKDGFTIGVRE